MHIDVPKDQILPMIEKDVISNMKEAMKNEKHKIEVEKVEWTPDGLRLHINIPQKGK